jgi:CheY-like chemotaxis protein
MTRILIIDDDTLVLRNVGEILEFEGYTVSIAEDGAEGIQRATTDSPDLIMCDISMPKVDGFGVLQALGSGEFTKSIPVIMITGRHDREVIQNVLAAGAKACLNKPFTRAELMDAITNIL